MIKSMVAAMIAFVAGATNPGEMEQSDNEIRWMVVSDPHVLAPSLIRSEGEASEALARDEMKLPLESEAILNALVDTVLRERPTTLLIAGDLTFNGELASHQMLVSTLDRLRAAGVNTLVIPGNHDISNPYAHYFDGDSTSSAPTVNRTEFAALYRDYGYADPARRDPNSLSYIAYPAPGIALLAIDSNRDEENTLTSRGDKSNSYHSAGRVKEETLDWIREQAAQAKSEGHSIVAMMHHHLLEHFDGEARVLRNYIVDDYRTLMTTLIDCDVRAVFTGHLHITDAVRDFNADGDSIFDVATGSLTTYPFPLRIITINNGLMHVDTRFLASSGEPWVERGRAQVENGVPILAGTIARKAWNRLDKLKAMAGSLLGDVSLPDNVPAAVNILLRHLRQPLGESLLLVTRGGEDPQQAAAIMQSIRDGVSAMIGDIMPKQANFVTPFVMENLMPRVEPYMRSALEDRNHVDTDSESSTNDHCLDIPLR